MNPENNPLLQDTNYFKQYEEEMQKLKHHPEILEFDKICYELFEMNPLGKKFMETCLERFVIPKLCNIGTQTYQIDCIWAEGFKEFPRMLRDKVIAHSRRIAAEGATIT